MALVWPPKDPQEVLDYVVNWAPRLRDETIVSSAFTIAAGANVSIVANSFSNTATTVWLAGGTHGRDARVTNSVTTSAGRTFEETVTLSIRQK